jgi:Ca2+-binding RTX toxin-like protein
MPSITISNRSSANVTSISGSINASVDENGSTSSGGVTVTSPIGEVSNLQNLFQPGGTSSEFGLSVNVSVDDVSIITDDLTDLPNIDLNLDDIFDWPDPSAPDPDPNPDVILPPSDDNFSVDVSIEDQTTTTSIPSTNPEPSETEDSISGEISVSSPDNPEGTTTVEVTTGGTTTNTTLPGSSLGIRIVGDGDDKIIGTANPDLLFGDGGNDTLDGAGGNDTQRGGQGDDLLIGGEGDDFLFGDFGNDTLTGGMGADSFVLRPGTITELSTGDVITDYNPLEGDQIVIMGDVLLETLGFEAIDLDGDGSADATLIRLNSTVNDGVLGIVLGSVDGAGQTTLGLDNLHWVS